MKLKGDSTSKTIDDELTVDTYSGMDVSYGIDSALKSTCSLPLEVKYDLI